MKKQLLLISVFILWFLITIITGFHHEGWADEAQSWLIARDCPLFDLYKVVKYEGTPGLWYVVLKFFQFLHLPYKFVFLIPIAATSIGLYLLLFKSKLPLYIKFLFPFTFFIAYQYSIFARNYCLIFPVLAFIATIYKDRFKKTILYVFLLIILAQISFYGFVISSVLSMFYMYETIKNKLINKKTIILMLTGIVVMTTTALLCIKPYDCLCWAHFIFPSIEKFAIVFMSGYFNVTDNTFTSIEQLAIVASLYALAAFLYCKNHFQFILSLFLNGGLIFAMASIKANDWHLGYIIIVFVFTLWIMTEENAEIKKCITAEKFFTILFIMLLLTQIAWSITCSRFDITKQYSGSKKASEFIKENNLDKYEISALGYRTVSVLPYFEKNIYKNFNKSYWEWNYFKEQDLFRKAITFNSPVIIFDAFDSEYYNAYVKKISDNYNSHIFRGDLFIKGYIKGYTDIVIFTRKDIL